MKAIYWKELRELAAVWIILLVSAVIFSLNYAGWHAVLDKILSLATLGGVVTGAVHGLLDRYRRNDLFLAHRPLSPLRLQLARTLAGVTTWLVPALVFLLVFRVAAPAAVETRFGRLIEPYLLSWSESLLLLGAMAASWALFRLIVGTRRLPAVLTLVFVLPVVTFAVVLRTSTLPAAFGVSLAIALVCTTTTVLGLANARRSALRAACLLLLGGVVLFESLGFLRLVATGLAMDTYPWISVTADGAILFRGHPSSYPGTTGTRHVGPITYYYRVDRQYHGVWRAFPIGRPVHLARAPWKERRHYEWPWYRAMERALNVHEGRRRQADRAPVVWTYEDGRFVCRERGSLPVLAGFGPDGFVSGPRLEEGLRFQKPRHVLYWDLGVYHYVAERHLVRLVFPDMDRIPRDSRDPVRVAISTKSLATPPSLVWPENLADARLIPTNDQLLWVVRAGDVLFRVAWSPEEEDLRGWSALAKPTKKPAYWSVGPVSALVVFSDLQPIHPARGTARVRVFRRDHPMLQKDIEIRPESAAEHAAATLRGSVTLPLPFPVAMASFFSAPPRTWDELYSWSVRDPLFAGGTSIGWLLLSLVLACACAWFARKQARMRCATERAVRFWTAAVFLLGPLGLVWMRLVLGRESIERIGGARRAVDLEASPATSEPWPEPLPTGTEVHA